MIAPIASIARPIKFRVSDFIKWNGRVYLCKRKPHTNLVTFKELISEYWAQTSFILTLVFGLIGYLVNRVFDLRKQKLITNHSLIQEHRMKAVNDFLAASTTMRTIFTSFPTYGMINNEIPPEEMDNILTEPLNRLKSRTLEIEIFFPDEEIFRDITQLYDQLNQTLFKLFTQNNKRQHERVISDTYASACNETVRNVDEKMKQLTMMVRKTYTI